MEMTEPFGTHELLAAQRRAEAEGRQCVVGAVVINANNQAFAQKRSANRRLFPSCWDILGGHVEPGETIEAALRREIREESGWELSQLVRTVYEFDWETEQGDKKREYDFLVRVTGDLEHPQLEWTKISEFRWLGLEEIEILKENRLPGSEAVYEIVKKGLEIAAGSLEEREA